MNRIGIDFGGTKIEAAVLGGDGAFLARVRTPNPGAYDLALTAVRDVILEAEREAGAGEATIGIGMPGTLSPLTGLARNSNSVWLNGKPFKEDLERVIGRPVRLQNDANCFALSEASDGAAAGAKVVFGAILGTGCGGGVAIDGQAIEGQNGIAGEWGHTPLPWPTKAEHQSHQCWCGRTDCLETYTSGSAFVEDYRQATGRKLDGKAIVEAARAGEAEAVANLDRYIDRLGRAFAAMCDILDPNVIVLGGGMSNVDELYERLPEVVKRYAFTDLFTTPIVRAKYGDSSGVRGAAWLWPLER